MSGNPFGMGKAQPSSLMGSSAESVPIDQLHNGSISGRLASALEGGMSVPQAISEAIADPNTVGAKERMSRSIETLMKQQRILKAFKVERPPDVAARASVE